MIDTVKIRSPYLSDQAAALIEQQMKRRSAIVIATGEVEYELTTGELVGSFDNRISVRLMREEMRYAEMDRAGRPVFASLPCAPYVLLEGSVHKAMLGHNITGGPQDFQASACWFVNLAAELLWVTLPHGSEWCVERVDVTECYRLSYEAIEEFIGSLNRVEYPRRKRRSYGLECLQFSGTTTAFSLYHKGPEFAKQGAKRLLSMGMTKTEVKDLQALANGIMRMEIQIKAKKLKADVESGLLGVKGEKPQVVQVTDAYLERVHDQEVARVIREGRYHMKAIRTAHEVRQRLYETYGSALAGSLYGLWFMLSTDGEKEARKSMPASTFRRQRAKLDQAGCSWAGTDVVIRHSSIPIGFTMSRVDPCRDAVEDPRITDLLRSYRQAA